MLKNKMFLFILIVTLSLSLVGCKEMLDGESKISGKVTDSNGNGIKNVKIKVDGTQIATTDEKGNWSFVGANKEEVTITAVKEEFDLYPKSITITEEADDIYFVESSALEDIYINFMAERRAGGSYLVECYIERESQRDAKERGDEFSNVKAMVNGSKMEFSENFPSSFHYRLTNRSFKPKSGGTIDVYLSHPSFGRIEKQLKVPEIVSQLEVKGDLNRWVQGEVDTVELNWSDISEAKYSLGIMSYNDNQEMSGGSGRLVNENKYILKDRSSLELYGSDEFASYVKIIVEAVNTYEIKESKGKIKFIIAAPNGAEVSTLP